MRQDSSKDVPGSTTRPDETRIEVVTLGPFETNCYIVSPVGGRDCWIIDASFEPRALIERVRKLDLRPDALLLTHAHIDHIAGVNEVLSAFPGLRVFIHEAERQWLSNPVLNLSAMMDMPVTARGPDGLIKEGVPLTLAGQEWSVFHTPGHSPGGIALYNAAAGAAIVGDTLFAGSIGRTDFPGSDFDTLAGSIRTKLYTLPDETKVYPGHGPPSTIGREKKSNPFVRP